MEKISHKIRQYDVFKVEKAHEVKGGYLLHMDYLNEEDYNKIKQLSENKGIKQDHYYAIKSLGRLIEEEQLTEKEADELTKFCIEHSEK